MSDLNDITEQDEPLPDLPDDIIDDIPDDIPVEAEESEPVPVEKKKPVAVGYRVLSAVLLLLSILGLFAGALGKLIPAFEPFVGYSASSTSNSAFSYTLLALLLELFQTISAIPKQAQEIVYVAVIMLCVVSVVISLITAIVAFCSGKRAKVCTHVNATALFLGYGALFVRYFAEASSARNAYKGMFDLPSAILAGIALIVLTVLVFADKREASGTTKSKLLNLVLLVLFYGCLFLFFVPATGTAVWWAETVYSLTLGGSFWAIGGSMQGIALCVAFALFAFNFIATAVRFQFKRSYLFDTIRFGLQTFAIAFVIIVAIAGSPADRMAVFKGNLLVTVAMLIAAVVLFLIPLLKVILISAEKRKAAMALEDGLAPEEEPSEEQSVIELPAGHTIQEPIPGQQALPEPSAEHLYQPQELDADAIFGTKRENVIDPKEKYIDEFVAEMIQSEEQETMFEPTNEPNQTLSDEVADEPIEEKEEEEVIVFTADNFDPNNPIIFGSSSEPGGMLGGNASFFAGSSDAPAKTEEKKKVFVFTEFEKEMAAQAKEPLPPSAETVVENDPRYPFMTQTVTNPPAGQAAQPIIQQTFITPSAQPAPQPQPEPVPERKPEPARPSYYDRPVYDTQFTYDPFINTLTPDERSEFGDVFISHRHGIQNYLPTYVIGGDNREFFSLLFIQLGHYRRFISQALMDKMYAFVSHR